MNKDILEIIKELFKQIPTFLLGIFMTKNSGKDKANELVAKAKKKSKK